MMSVDSVNSVCQTSSPTPGSGATSSKVKPSKAGPVRATVLLLLQLAMIAHIIHWRTSGSTLSPLEPSEAMQTVRHGIVNAGAVLFALALLATLIFGRWFCGWACHLVLLQDACGWLMKKMGIRPKPFRSRFLIYVPLILAVKMFLWPLIDRFLLRRFRGEASEWPGFSAEFVVTDYWHTFPGWVLAIPFLFICGFAMVYFLGAKGFCTYGCPYGGFFAPLDRVAAGRIRVTDACEQCRHCTAVCTSNVVVHAEVREYGMVVDPGCMKCMDCVSVCPKEALYFGFGRPAVTAPAPNQRAPRRVYDITLGEEFLLAGFFLLAMFSFYRVYDLIPLLMAAGMTGVATFFVWKLLRLWSDRNVTLVRQRWKWQGRMTMAGWVGAGVSVLMIISVLHSGWIRLAGFMGDHYAQQVVIPEEILFAKQDHQLSTEQHELLRNAKRWYTRALPLRDGGAGLLDDPSLQFRLAVVQASLNESTAASERLRKLVDATGEYKVTIDLAQILSASGNDVEAISLYEGALDEDPTRMDTRRLVATWYRDHQQPEHAIRHYREGLVHAPDRIEFRYELGRLLLDQGNSDLAIEQFEQILDKRRRHLPTRRILAQHFYAAGDFELAAEHCHQGLRSDPEDTALQQIFRSLPEALQQRK